jgi:SAM-dependent methyltransferase
VSDHRCRLCGSDDLVPILDLGRMPLANALLTTGQLAHPEPTYPLDLAFCETCSLLQITHTVPPEQLFRDYLYFSSFSDSMLRHAREVAERMAAERHLDRTSLVIEIASNDGYLLANYAAMGIPVLGIEPARNIAETAIARGVDTLCEFFGEPVGDRLRAEGRQADAVHANNVLAHVPDLHGFMAGLSAVLKPTGVAVVEVPYVKDMLDRTEFDTIYHEHLCYFSVTALHQLTARHALRLQHVERLAIHGGSLRCFVTHAAAEPGPTAEVDELLRQEADWGVKRRGPYEAFARSVRDVTRTLVDRLTQLKREGKTLAAYGAAAKGSTLLNYASLGPDVLEFVADRSPHKQGRFLPGVHVPIVGPEQLVLRRPDYVLLLTWNFAEEILMQQDAYRRLGGRFIIPLPSLRVM